MSIKTEKDKIYYDMILKNKMYKGLYTGIFVNEIGMVFLDQMGFLGFRCFSEIYKTIIDHHPESKTRFLMSQALLKIKEWNSEIQNSETNKALSLFPDIEQICKACVTLFVNHTKKNILKPSQMIRISYPTFREIYFCFLVSLSEDPFVNCLFYFDASKIMEKNLVHMSAIRNAFYACTRDRIQIIDQLVRPSEYDSKESVHNGISKVQKRNHSSYSNQYEKNFYPSHDIPHWDSVSQYTHSNHEEPKHCPVENLKQDSMETQNNVSNGEAIGAFTPKQSNHPFSQPIPPVATRRPIHSSASIPSMHPVEKDSHPNIDQKNYPNGNQEVYSNTLPPQDSVHGKNLNVMHSITKNPNVLPQRLHTPKPKPHSTKLK